VNTSKYPTDARKHLKRFQRTPGYQLMKQEHLAACERLETRLRERDEIIKRLKEKLAEAGVEAGAISIAS
jgi:predicted nuclease with TOPRIM domain